MEDYAGLRFFVLFARLVVFFRSQSKDASANFRDLAAVVELLADRVIFLPSRGTLHLYGDGRR